MKSYQSLQVDERFAEYVHKTMPMFTQTNNCLNKLIRALYKLLGRYSKFKFVYERYYMNYNKLFYYKNLYKNMISLDYLMRYAKETRFKWSSDINDIGCGLGPSGTAYCLLCGDPALQKELRLNLIDESRNQLDLAKNLLNNVTYKAIGFINIHINTIPDLKGISVFSYFICEQEPAFLRQLYNSRAKFEEGFIVIDYKKTISKLESIFAAQDIAVWSLNVCLSKEVREILGERYVKINGLYYHPKRKSQAVL